MEIAAFSYIGGRNINQDNFFINQTIGVASTDVDTKIHQKYWFKKTLVCGVFDGIGGGNYGEKASMMAAKIGAEWNKKSFSSMEFLQKANDAICDLRKQHQYCSIGTTAVVLKIDQKHIQVSHLGDSMCYRLREKSLECLTPPHHEYIAFLNRYVLTAHLGVFAHEHILTPSQYEAWDVQKGDMYLLCSDGIYTQLTEAFMLETANTGDAVQNIAANLVKAATKKENSDNATVIVVKI